MNNSEIQKSKISLYPQQEEALNKIKSFLQGDDSIFILRGYAGTGKTTMIRAILPAISSMGKAATLMVPTGRAANIIQKKSGCEAYTIHRTIYTVDKLTALRHDENGKLIETITASNHKEDTTNTGASYADDSMEFWFYIKAYNTDLYKPNQRVFIVDEASMISSQKSNNEIFHFGTDVLLNDLLTYARLDAGAKIIFVGDPAQLPPVGDNRSEPLNEDYFIKKGWKTQCFDLTEVVRQAADSTILRNAMIIRDVLNSSHRNELSFATKDGEVEETTSIDIVSKYVELSPEPALGNSVIVCYSNSMAKGYNDAIRANYYPHKDSVQVGDILQVVKNCYFDDGSAIFNGEFVRVLAYSESVDVQSAPVWVSVNGDRIRQTISLSFRDVTILSEDGLIRDLKIVDTLLGDASPNLNPVQHTALYINFRMRNPKLPKNQEVAARVLMKDPYYNALNVKYGYAITGHKSQGGDWNTVFVDYSGRTGLNNDSLRWMYTATTRAKSTLYGVNMPHIHPMDKLRFASVIKTNKAANNSMAIADLGSINLLPSGASCFQKAKCLSVMEALKPIGLSIERIELLQYKDRYYIKTNTGIERYDCTYNGTGYYTTFSAVDRSENNSVVLEALRSEACYIYQFSYSPAFDSLHILHAKMRSICDELNIAITNIVEDIRQYNVTYFLKTSGKFSHIKFYFDKNHFITYGQPTSDLGSDDDLLNKIIHKLS